jgi:hypothetical protein
VISATSASDTHRPAWSSNTAFGYLIAILAAVREATARLHVFFPISQAYDRMFCAELSRADGADDPGL